MAISTYTSPELTQADSGIRYRASFQNAYGTAVTESAEISVGPPVANWRQIGPTKWPLFQAAIAETANGAVVNDSLEVIPHAAFANQYSWTSYLDGSGFFVNQTHPMGGGLLESGDVLFKPNSYQMYAYRVATNSMELRLSIFPGFQPTCILLLADGRVLLFNGSLQYYNPANNTRTNAEAVIDYPATTGCLMADGRVYIPFSWTSSGATQRKAAIYNPATNAVTYSEDTVTDLTSTQSQHVMYAACVLLNDGRVLVGRNGRSSQSLNRGWLIYDPATNSHTAIPGTAGANNSNGSDQYLTCGFVPLPDGRVYAYSHPQITGQTNKIFDPSTNTLADTPSLGVGAVNFQGGCLLPNGRVFLCPKTSTSARIYDPVTNTFSTPASVFPGNSALASCVSLKDGRALIFNMRSGYQCHLFGGGTPHNENVILSGYYNKSQ